MTEEEIQTSTNILGLLDEAEEPVPWLIEGWLIEGELGMPHGPAHAGKTFLLIDAAMHLAFGLRDFHGFPIAGQRPVLYVPSEGRRGVSRRIGSWLKVHRPDIFELTEEDILPFPIEHSKMNDFGEVEFTYEWVNPGPTIPFERYDGPPRASNIPTLLLDDSEAGKKSRAHLKQKLYSMADEFGAAPLLIVDVVGDFTPKADENSREFGHAVKMLHPEELLEGDCTTLAAHHEGWAASGRPRGHSSLDGLVDARFGFQVRSNASATHPASISYIRLSNPKQRNEDQHPPIILTLAKPTDDLTTPVIQGRLEPRAIEEGMLRGWEKKTSTEELAGGSVQGEFGGISATEATFIENVRTLVDHSAAGGVVLVREFHDRYGTPKPTITGRRDALVEKGYICVDNSRGQGGFSLTPKAAALDHE